MISGAKSGISKQCLPGTSTIMWPLTSCVATSVSFDWGERFPQGRDPLIYNFDSIHSGAILSSFWVVK